MLRELHVCHVQVRRSSPGSSLRQRLPWHHARHCPAVRILQRTQDPTTQPHNPLISSNAAPAEESKKLSTPPATSPRQLADCSRPQTLHLFSSDTQANTAAREVMSPGMHSWHQGNVIVSTTHELSNARDLCKSDTQLPMHVSPSLW
jgi:hypothetical protein